MTVLGSHLSRVYNRETATDPVTSRLEYRNKKVPAICQSCFCNFSVLRLHPSVCQCPKRRLRRQTPKPQTPQPRNTARAQNQSVVPIESEIPRVCGKAEMFPERFFPQRLSIEQVGLERACVHLLFNPAYLASRLSAFLRRTLPAGS